MQNKISEPSTSSFCSLAGLPYIAGLGGFTEEISPYLYQASDPFAAGLPESGDKTPLFSSQEQLNFFASRLLSEYPSSAAPLLSSPGATPLYDPLIGFYFPQSYTPLLPAAPSSPLSNIMSDYVQYPSSPAPTPASNSEATPSPLLTPLPEPLKSTESKVIKDQPKKKAKKSLLFKRPRDQSPLLEDDDENDPLRPGEDMAARKRRQNTMAARRSRMRKVARMEELEKTVSELEKDKIQLQTRLAVLESEKEYTAKRDKENQDRIRALEAQLLDAYKNLPRS